MDRHERIFSCFTVKVGGRVNVQQREMHTLSVDDGETHENAHGHGEQNGKRENVPERPKTNGCAVQERQGVRMIP